jgi:hypothetical protein
MKVAEQQKSMQHESKIKPVPFQSSSRCFLMTNRPQNIGILSLWVHKTLPSEVLLKRVAVLFYMLSALSLILCTWSIFNEDAVVIPLTHYVIHSGSGVLAIFRFHHLEHGKVVFCGVPPVVFIFPYPLISASFFFLGIISILLVRNQRG